MYKKLAEEYEDELFKNFYLTELMLLKKGGRRIKSNENQALHILLRQKLEEYGISLFGQFEYNGLVFRSIRIFDDFPICNEQIIKQLYGYNNLMVHIQLRGFEDFSAAFDYNIETGECQLQRHRFGSITHRIYYDSLEKMMKNLKAKGYDNIFINLTQQ